MGIILVCAIRPGLVRREKTRDAPLPHPAPARPPHSPTTGRAAAGRRVQRPGRGYPRRRSFRCRRVAPPLLLASRPRHAGCLLGADGSPARSANAGGRNGHPTRFVSWPAHALRIRRGYCRRRRSPCSPSLRSLDHAKSSAFPPVCRKRIALPGAKRPALREAKSPAAAFPV